MHKILSLSLYLYLSLSLCFFWSGQVSSSLWSNVANVTSLLDRSLKVFSKCICLCHCLCLCICLCHCLFFGQFISLHHSNKMSQKSQVSRIALWWSSLNVFVFVIGAVFIFVFFGQVMSPHYSDQMSQRSQVSRISLWWSSLNVFVFVIFVSSDRSSCSRPLTTFSHNLLTLLKISL